VNQEGALNGETPRLQLRPFTPDDAPALAAYRSDPAVARYQSWTLPYRVQDAAALIAGMAGRRPGDAGWAQVALEEKASGQLIGDVALNTQDQQAELGVTLAGAAQGRGHAQEAVRALLNHAFGPPASGGLGLHRVWVNIDPRNVSVARLLTRLGFRHEGTHRQSYRHRGEWTDEAIWALLAAEWTA
jgi:RimJ/RimL family protein N-acetyltransferase